MHALELTEIVIEVVQYLSLQDQARCARVCKGWLEAFSPFVWFNVHMDDARPLPCPEAFVRHGHLIRSLRVGNPHLIQVLLDSTHPNVATGTAAAATTAPVSTVDMLAPSPTIQPQLHLEELPECPGIVEGSGSSMGASIHQSGKDKGKAKLSQSLPPPPTFLPPQPQHLKPRARPSPCEQLTQLHLACWESTRRMMYTLGMADYQQTILALASKWARFIALSPHLRHLSVEFYGQVSDSVLPALVSCLDVRGSSPHAFSPIAWPSSSSSSSSLPPPVPSPALLPSPSSSLSLPSPWSNPPPTLRSLDLRSYPLGREELVHVLRQCPLLEQIRLQESPFPDTQDPAPCNPTPIPRMRHLRRLEVDFRRDPPAAIALDLIEQSPALQELRLEVERLHSLRFLPTMLRPQPQRGGGKKMTRRYRHLLGEDVEIQNDEDEDEESVGEHGKSDEDEDDDRDEQEDDDGDDGEKDIGPSSRKQGKGCCPALHTLELEVCCEWIRLPTEAEAAALVEATMGTCRHLTMRGCTLLDTLTTNLLLSSASFSTTAAIAAAQRWRHRLVTLDVLNTRNAEALVLGVLASCPNLRVLRASSLSATRLIGWRQDYEDDDDDGDHDGHHYQQQQQHQHQIALWQARPWVCHGLREWSVAITGISRSRLQSRRLAGAAAAAATATAAVAALVALHFQEQEQEQDMAEEEDDENEDEEEEEATVEDSATTVMDAVMDALETLQQLDDAISATLNDGPTGGQAPAQAQTESGSGQLEQGQNEEKEEKEEEETPRANSLVQKVAKEETLQVEEQQETNELPPGMDLDVQDYTRLCPDKVFHVPLMVGGTPRHSSSLEEEEHDEQEHQDGQVQEGAKLSLVAAAATAATEETTVVPAQGGGDDEDDPLQQQQQQQQQQEVDGNEDEDEDANNNHNNEEEEDEEDEEDAMDPWVREERANQMERLILQQLGQFRQLEILRIGGCSSLDEQSEDVHAKTSYALVMQSGLEHLAGLKQLRVFGAYGVHHHVSWASLVWMVQQWPRLIQLEVINYEPCPLQIIPVHPHQQEQQQHQQQQDMLPGLLSGNSQDNDRRDWYQRVLDEIIV